MKRRLLVLMLLLVLVLLPFGRKVQGASYRGLWIDNLRQIGIALHNYRSIHGHFPTDIVDAEGKPLLSWRVHLLPFVEAESTYKKIRRDEPWDSAHNLHVAAEIPHAYYNPYAGNTNLAHFALVRGKGAFLPEAPEAGEGSSSLSKFILLVELDKEHAVFWTRPDTWRYQPDDPSRGLSRERIHQREKKGAFVMLGDGDVKFLPDSTPPELVRSLFDARQRTDTPLTQRWLEVLYPEPLTPLAWPAVLFSLAVSVWGLWILGKIFRGAEVSPGEKLVLVLGAQQLVYLVCFVLFFRIELLPGPSQIKQYHHALWFLPRLAGFIACLAVIREPQPQEQPAGGRRVFVVLAVLLAIASVDALAPHQNRLPEESFATLGAPFILGGAAIWLLCQTSWNAARGRDLSRSWVNGAALGVCLVPLLWFLGCWLAGHVSPREFLIRTVVRD